MLRRSGRVENDVAAVHERDTREVTPVEMLDGKPNDRVENLLNVVGGRQQQRNLAERLDGKMKRMHRRKIDTLPDGAIIARNGEAYAVRGKRLLRWTARGYKGSAPRPRGGTVDVLTPPAMLKVLKAGYTPQWHNSAN